MVTPVAGGWWRWAQWAGMALWDFYFEFSCNLWFWSEIYLEYIYLREVIKLIATSTKTCYYNSRYNPGWWWGSRWGSEQDAAHHTKQGGCKGEAPRGQGAFYFLYISLYFSYFQGAYFFSIFNFREYFFRNIFRCITYFSYFEGANAGRLSHPLPSPGQ